MKNLTLVNFLKGYAIFTIIVFHYFQYIGLPGILSKLISFGGTGVHLFVLLSGFGLYLSYLKRPTGYGTFLEKRLLRIYIPYITLVLLAAGLSLIFNFYDNSLYALGGHFFFYKMFDESIVGSYGYQLWFISMIVQFYLVFHLMAFLFSRMTKIGFVLLSTCLSLLWAVIVASLGFEDLRVWNSFFLQFVWEFALGMVLAKSYSTNYNFEKFNNKGALLAIGLLCCALYGMLAIFWNDYGKLFNDIPALFGYSLIALWIYSLKIKVVNRFFLYTGTISFSAYLLHFLCLAVAKYFLNALDKPLVAVVALILTYGISGYFQKLSSKLTEALVTGLDFLKTVKPLRVRIKS